MITLYNVLGVKDNATLEEIKASYRKLSLIYHPDVTGGNSEMYLKIQNAYNTLSDPQKRMEYDMRLYRLMHQSNNDNMRGQQNKENEYNNVTHQYRESRQANSSSKTSTNKDKQRQSAYHQAGVGCLTILAKSFLTVCGILILIWILNEYEESNHSMDKNIDAESDKLIAEEVVAPREESYYKGNQLKNGASPYSAYIGKNKYDKSIDNYILIKNGSKSDVVVLLYNILSNTCARNTYIQAGVNFKIRNIPQGIYKMKCFYGNDWNPNLTMPNDIIGGFETDVSFSETGENDYFDMYLKEDESGTSIPNYTVTLYQVRNGNLSMPTISKYKFFVKTN